MVGIGQINSLKNINSNLTISRANPPTSNNPPVWDSQPTPIFTQGTASNYELDNLTSDPDEDTVTISLNTGAASLPTGVTWNDTLDRLEYDGAGAINETTGHIATADDGSDTTNSNSFSIVITTAVVMDNWPFVYTAMALGNSDDRTTVDPAKTIIANSNFFISQSTGTSSSSTRETTLARLEGLRAINADINIIYHIDYLVIGWDQQGTVKSGKWLEQQTWDNPSDFDDYYAREAPGLGYMSHSNSSADGLAFNWGCSNTVMQRVVEGQIDQWTDFDGTYDLMPLHWMQDTIKEVGSNYRESGHDDNVTAVESSTEIDVPTWAGVSTQGDDAGDGYESLTYSSNLVCWQANNESGDYARITGHKVVNGSTDRLRLENSLENMTVAAGSEFSVFARSGSPYGSTSTGELSQVQWRTGIQNFGTRFINTVQTNYALDVDVFHNGGNGNWTNKRDGDSPTWPTTDASYWGGMHFEWIQTAASFAGKPNQQPDPGDIAVSGVNGYRINEPESGRNYEPDKLMMMIEYNKLLLTTDALSASGYPTIWLNALLLRYASNQSCYAFLTPYDAAYARFWHCLAWCMTNVSPQVEAERHDVPVWIDECIIDAGNPVSTRNFGTYDPEGNGGVEGSFVFDTADFGTFGYVKEFDNCWIIINLRDPGATDPWIPNWEPTGKPAGSGQTITGNDTWTVVGVPSGKKLQCFDRTTYTNTRSTKFMNKKMTDFDTTYIMKDDAWNDPTRGPQSGGGWDNDDTFDCGPLECAVLLLVDE